MKKLFLKRSFPKKIFFNMDSILFKILIPMALLIVIQMGLIIGTVVFGSPFKTFNARTVESFQSRLDMQKAYIESTMVNSWSNINSDFGTLQNELQSYVTGQGVSLETCLASDERSVEMIRLITDNLYLMLRKNRVTGAFFILNNPSDEKYGLYLRDYNPDAVSFDNGDILIEACPLQVKKELSRQHFDTSTTFEPKIDFAREDGAFYEKALEAGYVPAQTNVSGLGYWNSRFTLHGANAISYQIPVNIGGETAGVLGISVDKKYFAEKLLAPLNDIPNLCVISGTEGRYKIVCENFQDRSLKAGRMKNGGSSGYPGLYRVSLLDGGNRLGVSSPIAVYSASSLFADEEWFVVGLCDESTLFGAHHEIVYQLMRIFVGCLLISLIGICLVAIAVTRPILSTAAAMSNGSLLQLRKTGTREVDFLIDELKKSVLKAYALPVRLNRILGLANVSVAAFEYQAEKNTVSVTDRFFSLLDMNNDKLEFPLEEFRAILNGIPREHLTLDGENEEFFLPGVNRWLRLKYLNRKDECSGILQEITEEVRSRQVLEHERDYDALTGLLNRRGFRAAVDPIWDEEGAALMLMLDLDNLKYINDKYGHDFGDDYLNLIATALKEYNSPNVLTCHLSGDEFLLYAHGYASEEEIKKLMEDFNRHIRTVSIDIFGEQFYVQMSCGLAFKREEDNYEELLKKAEFAMYEVKAAEKNTFRYFSQESFNNNERKIGVLNRFNSMISRCNISYAFQPIVNLRTGAVLGYEALMRPNVAEFASPLTVIELARKAGRLKDVESITFFRAMETFKEKAKDTETLLFINSLSNQVISSEQFYTLRRKCGDIFPRVVVEICEEESQNKNLMDAKLDMIKYAGMHMAIDDYGTGYNNIATVLDYNARYLKIEGSLVRAVDKDEKKYTLAKSVVDYCKQYNILVIAESVETYEELKTVHAMGVDFVQGYLLQKPQFEIQPLSEDVLAMIKQVNQEETD